MKSMAIIVLVSFAVVTLVYLVYPKWTLAAAALMPGTPP